jgi:hypothetical protein
MTTRYFIADPNESRIVTNGRATRLCGVRLAGKLTPQALEAARRSEFVDAITIVSAQVAVAEKSAGPIGPIVDVILASGTSIVVHIPTPDIDGDWPWSMAEALIRSLTGLD